MKRNYGFVQVLIVALFLGGVLACRLGTPTPTSAPPEAGADIITPTQVPVDTPTSVPTDTPVPAPTETPTPKPTQTPTSVPTDTPIPLPELVPFEDPAGAFSLSYPADFDQVREGTEGYSYTFFAEDGSGLIYVYFDSLGTPFSDGEWLGFANSFSVAGMPGFGEDTVELDRQWGEAGEHFIYLEVESEEEDVHGLVWVEEAEGAMTVAVWAVATDQWQEQQVGLFESLDSFAWSPEAVQVVVPPPTPTATSVPPTSTPLPLPTSTPPPPPPSTWWPGQPEVPQGMACFLVVSNIGGEVTFNLGPQTQKVPPNGHIWFIIEPGHTTWTADMPDGRRGGGELDIQPGCEPFVNALSLSG